MGVAGGQNAARKKKAMFDSDSDGEPGSGSGDEGSDGGSDSEGGGSEKVGNVTGDPGDVLTINRKYAARFEHNKKRDEMQRLKEKVAREYIMRPGNEDEDSEEDESSDSDSDDGELPAKMQEQFAQALVRIKRKDPALYQPDTELFSDVESSSSDEDDADGGGAKKEKKVKKQTLRQVVASQLLEGGARALEDDDDLPERPPTEGKSYVEEQADLKKAFMDAADDASDDSDEDSGSDSERGGLKVKRRAEKFEDGADDKHAKAKSALSEYFSSANAAEGNEDDGVSKEDAFLRDYLMNEKWKEEEKSVNIIGGGYGDSSEEEVEEAEKFEHSYNFRFEEPDGAQIVSHARRIEGTVRREKTTRKDKRKEREERKLSEKERLKAEVRRLKNLKRQEIQEKMAQIASIGGLARSDVVKAANLTTEFDPDEHDRLMSAMYDDEYYAAGEGENPEALEKPEFGDLDDEVAGLLGKGGEEGEGNAEDSERFEKLRAALGANASGRVDDGGDDIDEDDDDEDDDEQEEGGESGTGNKFSKRAAKRWRKELMAKMDEYYKLDAEDFIGDIPCRFKYKQVAPSMYGLTTKEILTMSDKELTQIVPLKKLAPYRHDSDAPLDEKTKKRSQRMAREFLAKAAERKGKKSGKKGSKGKSGEGSDSEDEEAAAAERRKASYGARAWGKHNLNKRKLPEGEGAEGSRRAGGDRQIGRKDEGGGGGTKVGGSGVGDTHAADKPQPGGGKNAKKNAKKRAKKAELEAAKAAGMI